ncbi:MAG: hypothetical protein IJ877_01010 [Candidatus Gastranaerophilales bacterium]|nr:hypothetical protein [Candidatus Gastranaerophilales bacterium]
MKQIAKKEEYLAKIIHDLKTPATAQVYALKSLLDTTSVRFSQDEIDLIELTLNSCNYMEKLIDTFSNVFKLNSKKLELHYDRFNIVELVNEVLSEIKILLKYNKLHVEFNSQSEIVVNADRLQIKRVIENIMSNSINHAFQESAIKISISANRSEVVFQVENNSPYIKEKILNELFDKYKTYSSVFNRPGIGLGLYLSREIIVAHFGRMIAKSTPENVNTFGFCLPC